jgi:hypothetical protein
LLEHNKEVAVLRTELPLIDLGEELINGFQQYKAFGCMLKTYLCLSLSSNTEINLKAKLDYINEGLRLAEEKNQEAIRKDFIAQRQRILEEISKANAHKITYLQSRPLRGRAAIEHPGQAKTNVHHVLKNQPESEVQIELACDMFTEQTYKELHKIANGCKLLVLDLADEDDDGLVLEGSNLDRVVLSTDQAELIRRDLREDGASVEIVFLMSPCSEKQAQLVREFLKDLKVKLILYFKQPEEILKNKHKTGHFSLSQRYYFEQLKKIFLEKFLAMTRKKIAQSHDVRKLIHEISSQTTEEVNHLLKKRALYYSYSESADKFEEKNLHDFRFSADCIALLEPPAGEETAAQPLTCYFGVDSKPGIVDSSVKNWTMLGSELIYENRFKEILEIYDLLQSQGAANVEVSGTEGVGKSYLIRQFYREIGRRKLLGHGVYYVDCNDCLGKIFNPPLRDLITNAINSDLTDLDSWFHQNPDCLIIFDNFNMVTGKDKDIVVPTELFQEITAIGVKLLFVVDQKEDSCLEFAQAGFKMYHINQMTPEDCLQLVFEYGAGQEADKKIFFDLSKKGQEKFMNLETFKKVVGFPEKLADYFYDIIGEAVGEDALMLSGPRRLTGQLNDLHMSYSMMAPTPQKSTNQLFFTSEFTDPASKSIMTPLYKTDLHAMKSCAPLSQNNLMIEADLIINGCEYYTCKHCQRSIHR